MTNPTPHGQVPQALIDLIDEYAEARHINGFWVHNSKTAAARQAVIEALSGVQALSAAPAVPAAWKAVPVNPTPEMWKAAKSVPHQNPYGLVWDAMLAASPTPPAEQQAQPGVIYAVLPAPTASIGTDDAWHEAAMRDFADRTHAARLRCKSEQARLATLWGYVRADATPKQAAPKAAPGELSADSLRHQNKLLAETLGACILASGIVRKDIDGFTGPELLHFGEDLRSMLEAAPQPAPAEQEEAAQRLRKTLDIDPGDVNGPLHPRYIAGFKSGHAAGRRRAAPAASPTPTPTAEQQAAPKAAPGVGNSGFDHKTAADLLNNKTVSDEAVRKFVQASRWAHDEKASLSAMLLSVRGVLASREAEIALLKKALLEAEAAPQQEAQEPVAWLVPTLQTFKGAERVHFTRAPGCTMTDAELIDHMEGRVVWIAKTFSDSPGITDKFGVEHKPKPLYTAPQPAPATQQAGDVVAYLDVGAGGYLDLGSELSEDALQQLPKGRHALVIAGTYGIDGYVAAPQPSPTTKPAPQQEAQEPCPTCVALARTVMLDQVSFDRKPDCYGIRQITDDEGVEEWEDIRTSPDVAREEANDMMATGRGEIYEVVPLYTAPLPAPAPLSEMPYEKRKAIQEGEQISASDAWFHARHNMLDTLDRRNVFRAGFDRGWNAALAAQGGE